MMKNIHIHPMIEAAIESYGAILKVERPDRFFRARLQFPEGEREIKARAASLGDVLRLIEEALERSALERRLALKTEVTDL